MSTTQRNWLLGVSALIIVVIAAVIYFITAAKGPPIIVSGGSITVNTNAPLYCPTATQCYVPVPTSMLDIYTEGFQNNLPISVLHQGAPWTITASTKTYPKKDGSTATGSLTLNPAAETNCPNMPKGQQCVLILTNAAFAPRDYRASHEVDGKSFCDPTKKEMATPCDPTQFTLDNVVVKFAYIGQPSDQPGPCANASSPQDSCNLFMGSSSDLAKIQARSRK